MTPEEIIADYDSAVQVLNDYTAQEAAKIGNSQRSLGLMADRVASPSGQTSGLANYTYDRTMRPTVNTLAASLTTTGKAQALENLLNAKLREAKNNYEDAKNAYTVASTTPASGSGGLTFGEQTDGTMTGALKDESTGDPNAPATTSSLSPLDSATANLNAYAALTGGGQLPTSSSGTKFSYKLNGSTHTGYVYPGQGGEIDGMSFTKKGLNDYLNSKVQQGATFQNYLGNDTNYSIWKLTYKINGG